MMYKQALLVLCASLILAGCGPKQFWYKQGQTPMSAEKAELDCSVQALQAVPASIRQREEPGDYVAGTENCVETVTDDVRTKSCTKTRGYWKEGTITSYDANENTRQRYFSNCMAKKGFQRISLDECPGTVLRASIKFPALNSQSCYVLAPNNEPLIVSP